MPVLRFNAWDNDRWMGAFKTGQGFQSIVWKSLRYAHVVQGILVDAAERVGVPLG